MKVYFAHPWATETCGAAHALLFTLKKTFPKWEFVNPFISPLTKQWISSPRDTAIACKIMEKDLNLIDSCDIIIAYMPDIVNERAVLGTPMEIFYARFVKNKSTFCLIPKDHPWLLALDVECFSSVFDLCERLGEISREWPE